MSAILLYDRRKRRVGRTISAGRAYETDVTSPTKRGFQESLRPLREVRHSSRNAYTRVAIRKREPGRVTEKRTDVNGS
jgi:hypothetical protein